MAFDSLSANAGLTRAFTIGYRITDDPTDPWTSRFNAFKNLERNALRGGDAMMREAVAELIAGIGLDASRTVFLPSLSSGETVASPHGVLGRLAKRCAAGVGAKFASDRITKKAHEKLHLHSDAAKRRAILSNADFRAQGIHADNVVIVDDFITRGDTMSHVAQAIRKRNSGLRIYAVALGKTERRQYWRERFGAELSNEHVPLRWRRIWIHAA